MFLVVSLVGLRAAEAERLTLVDPSGSLEAAVVRSMQDAVIELTVVRGARSTPREVARETRSRFVVWRDGSAYVFLDAVTGQARRREVSTLDDELGPTALADDIVAWVVNAADSAAALGPAPALAADLGPVFTPPTLRIELGVGGRTNVARRYELASVMFSMLRRVGVLELGPTFIASENASTWKQQAYLVHVRYPYDGVAGTRGAAIPRLGAGVLAGRASQRALPGSPLVSESGLWPVAELGLTLEFRYHRFSFGVDVGGTFHLRQSLEDLSVDIGPHVEAALLARVGLLLY